MSLVLHTEPKYAILNDSPLISIIVPCYNQGRFLAEAIQSLVAQTYSDWECLVINDGSTDETSTLARRLAEREPRVRVLEQSRTGVSAARNRGLEQARGQFIQFLDADDLLAPEKLQRQLAAIGVGEEMAVAYCDAGQFSDSSRQPEADPPVALLRLSQGQAAFEIVEQWGFEGTIPPHAFLFDTRIFNEHGTRFDESLVAAEDWDCWVRIFELNPRIVFVSERLVRYRVHPDSVTQDRPKMRRGTLRAIDRQLRRVRGDERMEGLLRERKRRLYASSRAREFGRDVLRTQGLCRPELLGSNPFLWYLIRVVSFAKGALIWLWALATPSRDPRFERRWIAGEIIGYNLEALRQAASRRRGPNPGSDSPNP